MKIIAWAALLISLACTALYLTTGLTSETPMPWLNGFLVGPVFLATLVPTLFATAGKLDGGLAALRGAVPARFRGAPIGIGTVVAIGRTGLTVNGQPQLEIQLDVDTPDGRTFRATARQIVDLTELAAVRPGATLPVRYLPDGRATLAIDAAREEMQAVLNAVQVSKGHITPRQLHIAEYGRDAQAVVLAMSPTGEVRNGRTVARLTLRVTRPDGSMFDVRTEKAIPPSAVSSLQAGQVAAVKYLPQDESDVAIVTSLVP